MHCLLTQDMETGACRSLLRQQYLQVCLTTCGSDAFMCGAQVDEGKPMKMLDAAYNASHTPTCDWWCYHGSGMQLVVPIYSSVLRPTLL